MATLRYGSTGSDVKKLQQQLRDAGYNIAVDGIFGNETANAVKNLQKNSKISVDGVVGPQTNQVLSRRSTTVDGDRTESGDTGSSKYTYTPYEYDDYQKSQAVLDAEGKAGTAAQAVTNRGSYEYINQEELDKYVNEYEKRPSFTYDFNTDALYQQYKDKYIQQGKMAMADTIGQAAAMTGGYGNSYAVTAGSQAYQAHLDKLNDVIPELYQLAYNKDQDEVQRIKDMIAYHQGERDYGLGIWNDETDRLIADRTYYQGIADNLSADEYNKWYDGVTLGQTNHTNNENAAYNAWRDSVEDDFTERELKMKEEAWELEKEAYNNTVNTPSQTTQTKKEEEAKEADIPATKTAVTNRFIATHQTKEEYMRRGKSYKEYLAYIDAEIQKNQANFNDSELLYLKQYYGF